LLGDTEELSRRNALDIAIKTTSTDAFGITGRIVIKDLINHNVTTFIFGTGKYSG
jgi:hypothetical protein